MIDAKHLINTPFNSDPTNILYRCTIPFLKDIFPNKKPDEITWGDVSAHLLECNKTFKNPVKFKSQSQLDAIREELLTDFGIGKVLLLETVALCKDSETQAFIKLKYT